MSLFNEIITCADCPKVEALDDSNTITIEQHLLNAHRGASTYAYIIAVAKRCEAERDWIDSTYAAAKDYLDSDFSSNFLVDFLSRCWELCIYQYLIDNGITINIPGQQAGPDFDTSIGYVECVAVKRGEGSNAIPLLQASVLNSDGTWSGEMEMQPVPTGSAQLRISNGISEKIRKYQGYVDQSIIDASRPRIIALNWYADGSSLSAASSVMNYHPVMRTLFAMGPTQITINSETGDAIDNIVTQQPVVPNANGTGIDMVYFMKPITDDRDRIDGVIVSGKAPFVYSPDEFQSINNPFSNGFDIEGISIGEKIKALAHDKGVTISRLQ